MTKSIDRDPPSQVRVVRRFNRFYGKTLETLEGELLKDFSVAEMRILYELAHRPDITATELGKFLAIDAGYLSRLLAKLVRRRLIKRTPLAKDARHRQLTLSTQGQTVFRKLDLAAQSRVLSWLNTLHPAKRRKLIGALDSAMENASPGATAPYIFRPPRAGDFGWIIHRHGTVIAEEFGWDERFEALVAGIISDFVQRYDPAYDRCWVAEYDGEVVGSVFLMREDEHTAKLRLLYVEPHMRGAGIGRKLVEKAVQHAGKVGYRRVRLWTNRGLDAARRVYETAGFTLVEENPHEEFASTKLETLGQVWELAL